MSRWSASISSASRQDGSTQVKFKLGSYDESLPLTIDPDIAFSTFIGASQANWGFTAAFDDDGRGIGGAALWDGGMGTYPTTSGAHYLRISQQGTPPLTLAFQCSLLLETTSNTVLSLEVTGWTFRLQW